MQTIRADGRAAISRQPLGFGVDRIESWNDRAAVLEGVALLRPVYWIAGCLAAAVALRYGGIEAATITFAVLIALWVFAEPRTTLWLATAFMVFLFVFFQREAPLGDELPEEFFFWGSGLALITTGLVVATFFSSQVAWVSARKRFIAPASLAMLGMLFAILVASVDGLFVGNEPFAVVRQLFGCVLLPVSYFLGLTLLRSSGDVNRWIGRVSWCVALGSLWYAVKLSFASAALGYYYREQSPLAGYAGAIGVIAFSGLIEERRAWAWLGALAQFAICVFAILLMGSRAALASLVAGAVVLVIVMFRRRGVGAMALAALLVAGAFAGASYFGNQMVKKSGLAGDVSRRFVITVSEDASFRGRMSQMEYVVQEFERHPVLGAGMGSVTVFFAPGMAGRVRVTSVDNGWGYVMLKTGALGLAAFAVLMTLLFRDSFQGLSQMTAGRLRSDRMALLGALVYGLTVFWSGPSFFHFTSSAFFGVLLSGTVVLAEASRLTARAPAVAELPEVAD